MLGSLLQATKVDQFGHKRFGKKWLVGQTWMSYMVGCMYRCISNHTWLYLYVCCWSPPMGWWLKIIQASQSLKTRWHVLSSQNTPKISHHMPCQTPFNTISAWRTPTCFTMCLHVKTHHLLSQNDQFGTSQTPGWTPNSWHGKTCAWCDQRMETSTKMLIEPIETVTEGTLPPVSQASWVLWLRSIILHNQELPMLAQKGPEPGKKDSFKT